MNQLSHPYLCSQMFRGNAINFQAIFFSIMPISTNRFGQMQIYLPQTVADIAYKRSFEVEDGLTVYQAIAHAEPSFQHFLRDVRSNTETKESRNSHWFTITGNFRREQFTFNGRFRPRTSNSSYSSRRIMTFEIFGRFNAIASRFHWNLLLCLSHLSKKNNIMEL